MAVRSVAATDTLETFRTTFNTQASSDIGDMATLSSSISATSIVGALNELESEVTSFGVSTITGATDLGGAPATGDSIVINDTSASALRAFKLLLFRKLVSRPPVTSCRTWIKNSIWRMPFFPVFKL